MPGISGTIAAAFTPRGKNGDVDFGAFFDLLDFLGRARLAGVAVFTAAGEYPSVSLDERTRLTYLAVKRSRIPVLAGVGSSTLDHSVGLAREARDAGAAALLLPPPYFYALDPSDVHEFYARFAARLGPGTPTLLVNTPPLTPAIESGVAQALIDAGHYAAIVQSDPLAAPPSNARGCPSMTGPLPKPAAAARPAPSPKSPASRPNWCSRSTAPSAPAT